MGHSYKAFGAVFVLQTRVKHRGFGTGMAGTPVASKSIAFAALSLIKSKNRFI